MKNAKYTSLLAANISVLILCMKVYELGIILVLAYVYQAFNIERKRKSNPFCCQCFFLTLVIFGTDCLLIIMYKLLLLKVTFSIYQLTCDNVPVAKL